MNCRFKFIIFTLLLCLFAHASKGLGQVVVDNSFGNTGSLSGPNFKISDTLGKTVGNNLFHSFNEFSLQTGQSATFTGPDSIQNILGRVTGNKVSEIDGLIQSEITDANLYLLNPSGFLFGKNAKVDVDGAFTVSTRESLKLGDEGSFNAVNPEQSVFTSAAPDAFGFLGENPGGAIKFSGSKLIVENPLGLVGGDIKLEDSVIYAKSEGKATGVRIEGNNLGIVDSQIRNKSTVEVDGVKQGITIDLKGDLEITDTTITEEDGSGVDRGDFIDEIGSDVPFASKVGVLGVTEGFEKPDPISIKADKATITGGGVYSVNQVPEEKVTRQSQASKIELNAGSIQMSQGTLEGVTKLDDIKYVEEVVMKRSGNRVKVNQPPFETVGSVEVYLNGERLFEGVDYSLRFNNKGKLMPVSFTSPLPKGAKVEFIIRAKNVSSPPVVSLNTLGEVGFMNGSHIKAGVVEMDVGPVLLDASHVEGENAIGIQSSGRIELSNESSIKANRVEEGRVSLKAKDFLMEGQSMLAGSDEIELDVKNHLKIKGESRVDVGWKDAPSKEDAWGWGVFLWDSKSGKVVDDYGRSPTGLYMDLDSVYDELRKTHGNWNSINVIDINRPYDHASVPHIKIDAASASVEHGSFFGDSGGVKSALRINAKDFIQFSGDSVIKQFDQVEFNARSIELLKGLEFQSKTDNQNFPTGFLIVSSGESAKLDGATVLGSLIVDSGGDLMATDLNMGDGMAEGSYAFKLNAEGDVRLGKGKSRGAKTLWSRMLDIKGRNIRVDGMGLSSSSGISIVGANKIEMNGPFGIVTSVTGSQEVSVKAPETYFKDDVYIWANTSKHFNSTGKINITGSEILELKNTDITMVNDQTNNEHPVIELNGGQITLDNSSISQGDYYGWMNRFGFIYSSNPTQLTGNKITEIKATGSFKLVNKSKLSMGTGNVFVNAKDVIIQDSAILNNNIWSAAKKGVGGIEMIAENDMILTNADITSSTISSEIRANIVLKGKQLNSVNAEVKIHDERKGKVGSIQLDFEESVNMDKSQILSVGSSHLTRDTNGNTITINSKDLNMKDSLINGIVEGNGKRGMTQLGVTGEVSLDGSYVGGLEEPLESIKFEAMITDGTLGEVRNLGVGDEITVSSDLGEVRGRNLFHSFETLNIGSGQTAVLEMPDGVNNVFLRITGDEPAILNGRIISGMEGGSITLLNENGFELGPDVEFGHFSSIRIGALVNLKFDDGGSFSSLGLTEESLSGGVADYDIQSGQIAGSIRLIGGVLKDNDNGLESSEISLFGNNMEMVGGGISTIWGGDINLLANRINMERSAGLKAISPIGGEGGDIGIKSGELHMKWAEFGTSSVGGHGGDVVVDSNVIDLYESSVQANNYYGIDQGKHFKTGNIRITAKDSFVGYNQRVAIESNTPGGAGDLSVSAGQLIGDGTGVGSHSEFWIMAYRGYTGQLTIDADEFDARQVRVSNSALNDIYNPWFPNGMKKLSKAEKEVYGDITINARDIDLKNFILFYGNRINDQAMTLGDIVINAENDLTIGSVAIHSFHDDAIGMGGDITFQARNIINGMDPDKIDPTDYPSITRTGSLKFIAEENLELGRMKINGINISPTRELVTMFKGKEISLGMDLGDEAVSVENVVVEPESNPDRHSMVIQSEGDVHFVSGVNLSTPKLLLEASNLNINDSSIHLAGAYASEFKVRDEMNLRGGSLIESLSPTGKRSGKARDATTLNISSGQLTLDPGSSIRTINETGSPTDNKPIANLKIQSDFISLDDANIFSSTSNQSKAGDLSIEASGLSLNNGSALASFSYSQAKSGDVTIDAGQAVLAEKSFIANGFNKEILNSGQDPFAPGDAGDISINADRLRLEGGSFIRNAQIDMALSGDVSITSDEIKIAGRSFISTESIPLYQSDFSNRTEIDQNGSVSIKTKSLDLSESSYVKTTTVIPKRNAGDIIIEADAVSLSGRSSMLSNTEPNKFEAELGLTGLDYGNAGRLEIKTGSLQLADQSKISSDSFTSGDGGDVSLTATELAMANRSAIYAGALGQGEGGRITIDTAAMNLSGKSAVVADVRDSGNGGEVSVKAAALDMDESLIYGSTSGEGAGSRISVDTDSITLKNGARIESAASAGGAAGELVVQSGMVSITGMGEGFDPKDIEGGETGERVASGLLTSTEGSGDAGTIELKADQLDMQQGLIGSASTGVGAAGSVVLRLARGLSLGQGASVSVSSSQADGGDIEIESAGEVRFVRSELTASAAKDGGSIRLLGAGSTYIRDSRMSAEAGQDGGNITISKPELLFINRGQLSANAVHGYGGYIQVSANTYLPSIDSLITASSEYGAQGVVEIDTVETDIGSGLVVLPEQLEDRSVNLAERCALRLQGDVSSFFLNGQGGIPVWSKDTYLPTVIVPELDDTDRSRGQEDAQ